MKRLHFYCLMLSLMFCFVQSSHAQEERKHETTEIASWKGRQLKPLMHKGRPYFPIGGYGVIRKDDQKGFVGLKELKDNGWNIVLHGLSDDPEEARKTLDQYEKNQMAFIVNVQHLLYRTVEPFPDRKKGLEFIRAIKDHPALAGYYIFDEPENVLGNHPLLPEYCKKKPSKSELQLLPEFIKDELGWIKPAIRRIDPNPEHYLFMTIAWWTEYKALQPLCDVNMPNSYPTNHTKAEFEGDHVQCVYDASLAHQAAVASGKSRGFVFTPFVNDILTGIETYRSPTYREFRYSVFAPITRGAMGCIFWTGYRSTESYAKEVLYPVTRELASLEPFLLGKWRDNDVQITIREEQTEILKKYGNTPRVTACVRETEDAFLMILANNVNSETMIKVESMLWNRNTNLQEISAGSSEKNQKGIISTLMKPYEIKLYSWRK